MENKIQLLEILIAALLIGVTVLLCYVFMLKSAFSKLVTRMDSVVAIQKSQQDNHTVVRQVLNTGLGVVDDLHEAITEIAKTSRLHSKLLTMLAGQELNRTGAKDAATQTEVPAPTKVVDPVFTASRALRPKE